MLTRPARKLSCRLFSLVLAAVWGALILLGAVGMGRCASGTVSAKPAACTVCHCAMCHSLHPGGMARCCCHATHPPTHQAMLCARCDQGSPTTLAALAWHPLAVLPGGLLSAVMPPRAETFLYPPQSATSLRQTPPLRPPRLL